jgi:hypothetical protein
MFWGALCMALGVPMYLWSVRAGTPALAVGKA